MHPQMVTISLANYCLFDNKEQLDYLQFLLNHIDVTKKIKIKRCNFGFYCFC